MGYAVLHVEKGSSSVGGLGNHIDRIEGKEYSYKNADSSKKKSNFYYKELNKYTKLPLKEAVQNRIIDGYKSNRKLRTDTVKFCKAILSASHDDMKRIESKKGELNKWFSKNLKFAKEQWGAENIVRFVVHRDEKTTHIHCVFVPLTPDGRLSAKEVIGNAKKLRNLQDNYAIAMKEFGLKRGLRGSGAKHESVKEYYSRVNNTKNPLSKEKSLEYQKKIEKSILKPSSKDFLNLDKFQEKNVKIAKNTVKDIATDIKKDFIGIENALREKTKELARVKGNLYKNVENHKALNVTDYDVKYDKSGVVFSSEGSELLIPKDLILDRLNEQKFIKESKRERDKVKTAIINHYLNSFKKDNNLNDFSPNQLTAAADLILRNIESYTDTFNVKIKGRSFPLSVSTTSHNDELKFIFKGEDFKGEKTSFSRRESKTELHQAILQNLEHSQKQLSVKLRGPKNPKRKRGFGL